MWYKNPAVTHAKACSGYLESVLEKRYAIRKMLSAPKKNWSIVSACHAGLLADHQTPVGSDSIIYSIF